MLATGSPSGSPAPVVVSAQPTTVAQPPSDASASAPPAAGATSAGPVPCPPDMLLVDADGCDEVEQTCKRNWYDPVLRKRVCAEFAKPTRCAGQLTHRRYCIDWLEWPNRAGQVPEANAQLWAAQIACAAVDKRLCTESEWTRACEGPEMRPYPYGFVRDGKRCNGDHTPGAADAKAAPSGSLGGCVSALGVGELAGNLAELVGNESAREPDDDTLDGIALGDTWFLGERNQCRSHTDERELGSERPIVGFRCCAEPDGAASDPRTPRQRARGWSFERIERLAGTTLAHARRSVAARQPAP